ncbi:MAG: LPS export ABC transporter periplasmic protein LptC [Methylovulum sp.]|nr:LPS export ABC transporter periplasmic protein LptC [Methylovulum sp.]
MMSPARKYSYVVLVAIALASAWLVKEMDYDVIGHGPSSAHSPDYFSIGYTKLEMDAEGRQKNKLLADKMTHYSDDGTTHTVRPMVFFYNEKTSPWVVQSETGELSADGKMLSLNGKVVIERAKGHATRPLKINTANLKVKPETSYAETSERVELISPPNVTTGTGMRLVFVAPIHLELLANVQGNYEKK